MLLSFSKISLIAGILLMARASFGIDTWVIEPGNIKPEDLDRIELLMRKDPGASMILDGLYYKIGAESFRDMISYYTLMPGNIGGTEGETLTVSYAWTRDRKLDEREQNKNITDPQILEDRLLKYYQSDIDGVLEKLVLDPLRRYTVIVRIQADDDLVKVHFAVRAGIRILEKASVQRTTRNMVHELTHFLGIDIKLKKDTLKYNGIMDFMLAEIQRNGGEVDAYQNQFLFTMRQLGKDGMDDDGIAKGAKDLFDSKYNLLVSREMLGRYILFGPAEYRSQIGVHYVNDLGEDYNSAVTEYNLLSRLLPYRQKEKNTEAVNRIEKKQLALKDRMQKLEEKRKIAEKQYEDLMDIEIKDWRTFTFPVPEPKN